MKKLIFCGLLSVLLLSPAFAQYGTERTGYEGDYFSLEGALDLFKNASSLRDFERRLNTEENWVNNLDLNYDSRIDYIRVEHRRQGNFHAVILQAILDRYNVQDVAVIEIEITGRREAVLQIVGDEDLYGEEVIVEPVEGYTDSRSGYRPGDGSYVNVYYWRPVQYLLGRQYRVYVSPYRWQFYPTWWRPWAPCTWNIFRPRIVVYQRYYQVVRIHRVVRVHNFYRPYRSYSPVVVQRANKVRVRHGRAPIQRPAPAVRQNGRPGDFQGRNGAVQRPDRTTPPGEQGNNPMLSRKRTQSAADPQVSRSNPTRVSPRSDNAAGSPERPRSTVKSRNASGNTAPQVERPSRNATPRPEVTTRPTTPTRKSTPPKVNRSTPPRVEQPARSNGTSRGTITRSRPATRSTTPARKSAPPKANRSAPPKADQRSRSKTNSSGTINRSRPATRSTAPARKSAPPKANRSAPLKIEQRSRSKKTSGGTISRSRPATRSTTPARKPSVNSRAAMPAAKPKATRSAPSKSKGSKGSSRRSGGGRTEAP